MVHKKYRDFFIYTLRINANDFDNEYKKVIEEYGQSNETKLKFYKTTFYSKINLFKNETPLDSVKIQRNYEAFIHVLKQDNILVTDLVNEKSKFSRSDLKVSMPNKQKPTYNIYNLNTKYGRRKAREQAQRNYENGSDEYRNDIDNIKIVVWLIIIAIVLFIFIIKARLQ